GRTRAPTARSRSSPRAARRRSCPSARPCPPRWWTGSCRDGRSEAEPRVTRGPATADSPMTREVRVPVGDAVLDGDLVVPPRAKGLVIFAHGSGSGRHSPRNREVAAALQRAGLGTLLLDLLTPEEEAVD